MSRRTPIGVALIAGAAMLAGAATMFAASFTVNPLSVRLSPRTPSQLVTISNQSKQEIRFEVKAFAWDHDESDAMKLDATSDITFFPNVLTLAPGKSQKVRVGTSAAFGATERPYRIFVEELPAGPKAAGANAVAMRTRIGIPVFLDATTPNGRAEIADTGAQNRAVSTKVRNSGNTHVMVDTIEFKGLNQAGQAVFTRTVSGWYVLAGRTRQFSTPMSAEECQAVRRVEAKAVVSGTALTGASDAGPSACTPAGR